MKRIISIFILIITALTGVGRSFDEVFVDSTLRIDVKIVSKVHDINVSIDSIAQWTGWYGRRCNLDKEQHPEVMKVSVIDCVTADTIYVDSKCPEAFGDEDMHSDLYATFLVPKPRHDCKFEIKSYMMGPEGRKEMQSVSKCIYSEQLDKMNCHTAEPKYQFVTIRRADDLSHCINLAILAEGYMADEMDKFIAQATALDSALFCQPGFSQRKQDFNVVAVLLPSEESGITIPSANFVVNSALKAHFDSYGLERLVTVSDSRRIWDAIECIPASQILILANTEKYGGSGSYNEYAIASAGQPRFTEILIHEFGHSFGWLGDEYEVGGYMSYPPDIEPQEPNITTLHDFSGKWQELIDSGEASLIEGAGYQEKGVWRGCEHCLMRAIEDSTFCVVCARAITKAIEYHTGL